VRDAAGVILLAGLEAPGRRAEGGADGARALEAGIRAIVLARAWAVRLERGEAASAKALAREEGLCNYYLARLLPLAYLAPDLTTMILEGRQPRTMTLSALTSATLPTDWELQRQKLTKL
jgi:site-specific DNA recombinase